MSSKHLLVTGKKTTPCSVGLFSIKEERLQYVHDVAVTQRVLDQSKLSPFSFLDSRNIDKLTKTSINLATHSKNVTIGSENFHNSDLQFHNFQQLVQATAHGYSVYPNTTSTTKNLFQKASYLAASVPTPNSSSENKKVWDKFVIYSKNKSFNP